MKTFVFCLYSFLLLAISGLLLQQCLWTPERIDIPCPSLTDIIPDGGHFDDTITIKGAGFLKGSPELYVVSINGKELSSEYLLTVPDDSTLTFKVPRSQESGDITIGVVGGCNRVGAGLTFTYYNTVTMVPFVFAGQVSGTFNSPRGMDVDPSGNVFVADRNHHTIKRITPDGNVTRYAGIEDSSSYHNDPIGLLAKFRSPSDVALDGSGNIYVADETNHCIRIIYAGGSHAVDKFSGDPSMPSFVDNASLLDARYTRPVGVAIGDNQKIYVTEFSRHRLRMLDLQPSGGFVTTLLGNASGTSSSAELNGPVGVAFSIARGSQYPIFVADMNNQRVRGVSLNKTVINIPSSVTPSFLAPNDIDLDISGVLYVVDRSTKRIFAVYPNNHSEAIAGLGINFGFETPYGIAVDKARKFIYVSDETLNVIVKFAIE